MGATDDGHAPAVQPWFSFSYSIKTNNHNNNKIENEYASGLHSSFKWPHRWQGTWPLHLIFRLLHSLLEEGWWLVPPNQSSHCLSTGELMHQKGESLGVY
jgi:hypothetical protein